MERARAHTHKEKNSRENYRGIKTYFECLIHIYNILCTDFQSSSAQMRQKNKKQETFTPGILAYVSTQTHYSQHCIPSELFHSVLIQNKCIYFLHIIQLCSTSLIKTQTVTHHC